MEPEARNDKCKERSNPEIIEDSRRKRITEQRGASTLQVRLPNRAARDCDRHKMQQWLWGNNVQMSDLHKQNILFLNYFPELIIVCQLYFVWQCGMFWLVTQYFMILINLDQFIDPSKLELKKKKKSFILFIICW